MCLVFGLLSPWEAQPQVSKIEDKFFGIHLRWGASSTPLPFIHFGSWRIISPETEWRGLEATRGNWNFATLDEAVKRAESRSGFDLLLSLGQTPKWAAARPDEVVPNGPGASSEPADMGDWENYIRTVSSRYKGRIRYYEMWNEPYFTEVYGNTGRGHFTGSAITMVKMAAIAKRVLSETDPDAKLIGPACVGKIECLEAFLRAGGGKHIDIIAFHFYDSPEYIPKKAKAILGIAARYGVDQLPLWNTESGYLVHGTNKNTDSAPSLGESFRYVLTQEELPGHILKAMVYAASSGVARYYHYSWDIPGMHVMWKRGVEPTPASSGYAQLVRWLKGSTVTAPKEIGGVVISEITSPTLKRGLLVWSEKGPQLFVPESSFQAVGFERLSGEFCALNTPTIKVGASPILIRQEKALW